MYYCKYGLLYDEKIMSVMDSNLRYRQLPTLSQLDVSSEVRFGPLFTVIKTMIPI